MKANPAKVGHDGVQRDVGFATLQSYRGAMLPVIGLTLLARFKTTVGLLSNETRLGLWQLREPFQSRRGSSATAAPEKRHLQGPLPAQLSHQPLFALCTADIRPKITRQGRQGGISRIAGIGAFVRARAQFATGLLSGASCRVVLPHKPTDCPGWLPCRSPPTFSLPPTADAPAPLICSCFMLCSAHRRYGRPVLNTAARAVFAERRQRAAKQRSDPMTWTSRQPLESRRGSVQCDFDDGYAHVIEKCPGWVLQQMRHAPFKSTWRASQANEIGTSPTGGIE